METRMSTIVLGKMAEVEVAEEVGVAAREVMGEGVTDLVPREVEIVVEAEVGITPVHSLAQAIATTVEAIVLPIAQMQQATALTG
jgi:hypothetical protein